MTASAYTRPGIYGFLVSKSNHMYIGAAGDVDEAIDELTRQLENNRANNCNLQQDWRSYGEGEFDITILEELPETATPQDLEQRLTAWLTLISYAERLDE